MVRHGSPRTTATTALGAALGLATLAACGQSTHSPAGLAATPTPAASPTPASIPVQLFDGLDGRAVPHASISVGSATYEADDAGTAALPLSRGDRLTITAPGFVVRQTLFRGDGRMSLWNDEATPLDYIQALVYQTSVPGFLVRPEFGAVQLVMSPEVEGNGPAAATVRDAAAEITDVCGGRIVFSVDVSSPVKVSFVIDPALTGYAGVASRDIRDNRMVACRIRFQSIRDVPGAALHEIGHCLGLGHSADAADVMYPRGTGLRSFSDRERRIVTMMLLRLPGNTFPDNDQGVMASAANVKAITVD